MVYFPPEMVSPHFFSGGSNKNRSQNARNPKVFCKDGGCRVELITFKSMFFGAGGGGVIALAVGDLKR